MIAHWLPLLLVFVTIHVTVTIRRQKVDQAAIVETNRLHAALAYVAERQNQYDEGRSIKAQRRRRQSDCHMFKSV
jgi:hypothetical protein